MMKGSMLVWIEAMTCQFAMRHPTDSVDEVPMVKIFKTILVGVMSVRTAVKLMSQRVLDPVLIMNILGIRQDTWNNGNRGLTQYSSSLNMKGIMA